MITVLQSAERDWPIHTEMILGVGKALYPCPTVRGKHLFGCLGGLLSGMGLWEGVT